MYIYSHKSYIYIYNIKYYIYKSHPLPLHRIRPAVIAGRILCSGSG